MSGRTLREALAVALEAVPSAELASGDKWSRAALREHLLRWIKEYALNRGVIFEDADIELELGAVIAELRVADQKPVVVRRVLEETCTICNAKPGEFCSYLLDGSKYRETPHAMRIGLARNTERS